MSTIFKYKTIKIIQVKEDNPYHDSNNLKMYSNFNQKNEVMIHDIQTIYDQLME